MRLHLLTVLWLPLLLIGCGRGPSSPPDVVLVTIDTLRADRLGSYGYTGAETPVLDQLAREGVRFAQCTSPVPITLPSHASILTGQLPSIHGVRNNTTYRLGSGPPTLAEEFRRHGYDTGAVIAALPLVATGLERGFDFYQDHWEEVERTDEFLMAERPADDVVELALEWVGGRASDRPVFLWVHFFEPHQPYTLVPPFDERFADRPYDGEVAAADRAVGRLLDGVIARRGAAPVTVVTSDHGEGLGEHGEETHAIFLFETTLRVPLLFHAPGRLKPRVVDTPVGLIDIAPTLAALLGWRETELVPDGVAVLPDAAAGRDLHAESLFGLETYRWSPLFALRKGNRKVIQGGQTFAFDLAEDPHELRNLEEASWVGSMREELRSWIQTRPDLYADAAAPVPSAEQMEALAALGYVGSSPPATADDLLAEMERLPDPTTQLENFARMSRAREALLEERPLDAVEALRPVVSDTPDNIWALLLLGDAWVEAGNPGPGIEAYQTALEHAPDWVVLHHNLGEAYVQAAQPEEALAAYRAALALDPDRLDTVLAAASLLQSRGEFDAALALLEPALARDDVSDAQRADLLAAQARLQLQRGDLEASQRSLDDARRLDDRPEFLTLQALQHRRGRQWAETVQLLGGREDLPPEAALYLGEAHQMLGQVPEATRWYRACLAAQEGFHLAHNNLAWILAVNQGRPADALPHAQRALDLFDGEPEYHDTYLEVLERLNQLDAARQHAQVAAARFPQHAGLRERLARYGP